MQAPKKRQLNTVKRIFLFSRKVKENIYSLKNGYIQIKSYSNVDWVRSPTNRRMTIYFYSYIRGNLVIWKSNIQNVVARLSVEVEYRTMAYTTCELIRLKYLLQEMHKRSMKPHYDKKASNLYCKQSCLSRDNKIY